MKHNLGICFSGCTGGLLNEGYPFFRKPYRMSICEPFYTRISGQSPLFGVGLCN